MALFGVVSFLHTNELVNPDALSCQCNCAAAGLLAVDLWPGEAGSKRVVAIRHNDAVSIECLPS